MDFAVSGPLVQRSRLVPGSCPSTRMFALRFLQTSPHGDRPCVVANPSPPSGWAEDFHLQATEHVQHTTKSLRGRVGKRRRQIERGLRAFPTQRNRALDRQDHWQSPHPGLVALAATGLDQKFHLVRRKSHNALNRSVVGNRVGPRIKRKCHPSVVD
jgi:hypothetical protein